MKTPYQIESLRAVKRVEEMTRLHKGVGELIRQESNCNLAYMRKSSLQTRRPAATLHRHAHQGMPQAHGCSLQERYTDQDMRHRNVS